MISVPSLHPHFGKGELALDLAKSVFINCPFDAEYAVLFDVIVFATVCCGFTPRCALESGDVAEPRLSRITRAVFSSKYSIHDLSRCKGEGDENFGRFNMPLELGIAMACRFANPLEEHDWLVLVPSGHAYLRFMSDLAGYDPVTHDGSVPRVVGAVMRWLCTRKDAVVPVTPTGVLAALPRFAVEKSRLEVVWGGRPPWADVVRVAFKVARSAG